MPSSTNTHTKIDFVQIELRTLSTNAKYSIFHEGNENVFMPTNQNIHVYFLCKMVPAIGEKKSATVDIFIAFLLHCESKNITNELNKYGYIRHMIWAYEWALSNLNSIPKINHRIFLFVKNNTDWKIKLRNTLYALKYMFKKCEEFDFRVRIINKSL